MKLGLLVASKVFAGTHLVLLVGSTMDRVGSAKIRGTVTGLLTGISTAVFLAVWVVFQQVGGLPIGIIGLSSALSLTGAVFMIIWEMFHLAKRLIKKLPRA